MIIPMKTSSTKLTQPKGRKFRCDQPAPALSEQIDRAIERREQGNWVPACGGTETPFVSRSGMRLLYCWQPSSGRHAYINCDSDIVLTDAEAMRALGVTR